MGFQAFFLAFKIMELMFCIVSAADCGGIVNATDNESFIFSPNFPRDYNNNEDCTWTIKAPSGETLELLFSDFQLEEFDGCKADSLEIYDFDDAQKRNLIGSWCGTDAPPPILSSGSKLEIVFHSDKSTTHPGFLATWKKFNCGFITNNSSGILQSPFYPFNYTGNKECRWDIVAPHPDRLITIKFSSDFDIETGRNGCDKDYVEIFDPINNMLVSRGKFCGSNPPPPLLSYFKKLVVKFHSDAHIQGKGFSATWESDLPCQETLNSNHGELIFPNINAPYPNNENCTWDIHVDKGYSVRLTFNDKFELEDPYDMLQIQEISTDTGKIKDHKFVSGTVMPGPILTSTSFVRLHFTSDESAQKNGFGLSWDVSCGRAIDSVEGHLASPDYRGSYLPNLDCEWRINTLAPQHLVLDFDSPFGLEPGNGGNCSYDSLEVFDTYPNGSRGSSLGTFCGKTEPPRLVSSSPSVILHFHTDQQKSGIGFSLSWKSVCGAIYTGSEGVITSPNFPSSYPNGIRCQWDIHVDPGQLIRLTFPRTFEIEPSNDCTYDFLEVYDCKTANETLEKKGRYCGNKAPLSQVSSGNCLRLVFQSDSEKPGRGFEAEWTAVPGCGGKFHTAEGLLMSPNYPGLYPDNLNCRWVIDPNQNYNLTLTFNSIFDVEKNDADCSRDYVEISIGQSGPHRWCGRAAPPTLTSHNETVTVVFKSDKSRAGKGFFLIWTPA